MVLPAELVGNIINEAYMTPVVDEEVALSIALTSHTFRIILNRKRFGSIEFFPGSSQRRFCKIKDLARIIESGKSIPTLLSLCDFVLSCNVKVVANSRDVVEALEDGSLSLIFDNLFRPRSVNTSSNWRSLHLLFHMWGQKDFAIQSLQTPWSSINPTLVASIRNLIQFSDLNGLTLHHKWENIPRDILQVSKVKRLRLLQISISYMDI